MDLNAEQRADLRRVLGTLDAHVLGMIRDRIDANHESSRPRAPKPDAPHHPLTLEQVTYNAGVADGMSELWAELTSLGE